jgi:hypothetical protein
MSEHTVNQPDPSKIMQIGMGFWATKTLLAAVKFRLFTLLAAGAQPGVYIKDKLGLQTTDRHVFDWLDALYSMGFLQREGSLDKALYSNSPDTDLFLDTNKRSYIGGILEMGNNRLYRFWGDLEEGLLTGQPQNESKHSDKFMEFTDVLYQDPEKVQEFADAMSGIQMGNFKELVNKCDFSKYNSLADIGGSDGTLSIQVCLHHRGIRCLTFDLPAVEPLAKRKVEQSNLSDRIEVLVGDFLKDELPAAEVIVMGNILHGMTEEGKQDIMKRVYRVLPEKGVFIAIENVIDNERKANTFGLLMSLNMLIENGDAFDYTFDDFQRWADGAGFDRTELLPLAGPSSAALAYK